MPPRGEREPLLHGNPFCMTHPSILYVPFDLVTWTTEADANNASLKANQETISKAKVSHLEGEVRNSLAIRNLLLGQ